MPPKRCGAADVPSHEVTVCVIVFWALETDIGDLTEGQIENCIPYWSDSGRPFVLLKKI
jgi:hypothetical protein